MSDFHSDTKRQLVAAAPQPPKTAVGERHAGPAQVGATKAPGGGEAAQAAENATKPAANKAGDQQAPGARAEPGRGEHRPANETVNGA